MSLMPGAVPTLALLSLHVVGGERIWHKTVRKFAALQGGLNGDVPGMESYLAADQYATYVQNLDPSDAAVVHSVSALERDWSGQVVLYHATTPYIFFGMGVAWSSA